MDSLNLFSDKPLEPQPPPVVPRRRPQRPLWLILVAAALVPGAGHILLRKVREGVAILLLSLFAQILLSLGFAMGWPLICWIGLRSSGALYLYAVADAALLRYEMADGRSAQYPESPRRVAFWNLVGYGAGYEMLGMRVWALGAGGAAFLFHFALALMAPKLAILGELILVASAVHAYMVAYGDKRTLSRLPEDTTPPWLRRSLLITCALTLVFTGLGQWVALQWRDSLHLQRQNAVAVEPFYDNPHYGLHLEMPSPGWEFLQPTGDELFAATHLTENALMDLRIAPRSPNTWSNRDWAQKVLNDARQKGWNLQQTGSSASTLGELSAWSLSAAGSYHGSKREVRIVTAARGLQHITLWYEWSPSQSSPAATQVGELLASVQLH